MNDDVKEWLSLTKDDLWAYPGLALLAAACFLENVWVVVGLMLAAALFFTIYFVRSMRKYLFHTHLARLTRVAGMIGNLLVLVIVLGIAWGKLHLLYHHTSTFEFLRSFHQHEGRETTQVRPQRFREGDPGETPVARR